MKKLLFPVILLVALAACSKEEIVPALSLSRTNIEIGAAGGDIDVNVTSNVSWSASSSASGWATVSPASGDGNGSVKITIAENGSLNQRDGKVTVKVEGIEIVIEIEQDGQSKEEFLSGSKWELTTQNSGASDYDDLIGTILELKADKSALALMNIDLGGVQVDRMEGTWTLDGETIKILAELMGIPASLSFEIKAMSDNLMECIMSDNIGFIPEPFSVVLKKK